MKSVYISLIYITFIYISDTDHDPSSYYSVKKVSNDFSFIKLYYYYCFFLAEMGATGFGKRERQNIDPGKH